MFLVRHKDSGEIRKAYALCGMHFLFWDKEEDSWVFGEIQDYRPVEEE